MPTFRRIRRSVAAILLVLYLPACTHWVQPKGMTPQAYIAAKHPGHVRLTLADSSRTELLQPSVAGDSVIGFLPVPCCGGGYKKGEVVSVPSAAVLRLEAYKLNTGATVALVIGTVVVVGTVVVSVAASQWEFPGGFAASQPTLPQ